MQDLKTKILMVGYTELPAMEVHYKKQLEQYYDVRLFNAGGKVSEYRSKGIINKVIFRLGISKVYRKINAELLVVFNQYQPRWVWIFKGMEVFPTTLKHFKAKGAFLFNYNGDSPFNRFNRGAYNDNIRDSLLLYDYYFSYSKQICKEIEKRGVKSYWFPFAADTYSVSSIETPSKELKKLCFVGNFSPERLEAIVFLLERAFFIDIYGQGWEKLVKYKTAKVYNMIIGEEFKSTFSRYRVQLNFLRSQNDGSHNMRSIEASAYGGIQLTRYSEEQAVFFLEDEEVFFYSDYQEMADKANYLLGLSAEKALGIKKKALEKAQLSYTYSHRVKQLKENVFSLFLNKD